MKICFTCKELKEISEFTKTKVNASGTSNKCKSCKRDYDIKYRRSITGFIVKIYNAQKYASKHRGHALPNYSKAELKDWITSRSNFNKLYSDWENSGFKKDLVPSCDRLDDYKPYTLENIRLVTWAENNAKGHLDAINGINNKSNKPVLQFDINGNLINEFYSQSEASRRTGITCGNINNCIKGRCKTANLFVFVDKAAFFGEEFEI